MGTTNDTEPTIVLRWGISYTDGGGADQLDRFATEEEADDRATYLRKRRRPFSKVAFDEAGYMVPEFELSKQRLGNRARIAERDRDAAGLALARIVVSSGTDYIHPSNLEGFKQAEELVKTTQRDTDLSSAPALPERAAWRQSLIEAIGAESRARSARLDRYRLVDQHYAAGTERMHDPAYQAARDAEESAEAAAEAARAAHVQPAKAYAVAVATTHPSVTR